MRSRMALATVGVFKKFLGGEDDQTAFGRMRVLAMGCDGERAMRIQFRMAVMAAICVLASSAHANGDDQSQGVGRCKEGFADGTRVNTEYRGEMPIGQVLVGDRVWSFNQIVGKPGWSKVLQRIDRGQHYVLLSDFTEPGSSVVTKACWRIARTP